MWAVAEVSWEDPAGVACVFPATIEDTSPSGACIRLRDPIAPGSKVTVKWHREQFSAIARNCRRDGYEYLLGVRRVPFAKTTEEEVKHNVKEATSDLPVNGNLPAITNPPSPGPLNASRQEFPYAASSELITAMKDQPLLKKQAVKELPWKVRNGTDQVAGTREAAAEICKPEKQMRDKSSEERKVMEPKNRFPKFWRRESNAGTVPPPTVVMEGSVNKTPMHPPEAPTGVKGNLLSYEDIYRAAGILRLRSGYDINKVVEMLHCERLRNLSDDVKRASVLMAVEAAGSSAEDLLRDANERQQALDAYEEAQKTQVQEFETRKAQENAQIEAEMASVTARYAERIKANLAQVDAEKEALRGWQMVKQHECQRILEVTELCSKPAEPAHNAVAASAGAGSGVVTARNSSGPSLVS